MDKEELSERTSENQDVAWCATCGAEERGSSERGDSFDRFLRAHAEHEGVGAEITRGNRRLKGPVRQNVDGSFVIVII